MPRITVSMLLQISQSTFNKENEMEFTTALVMILSFLGLTFILIFTAGMVKAEGDIDFLNVIMGISSSFMAFGGIQSGLKTDYGVSIAIIGLISLLYTTIEARDDLRAARAKFVEVNRNGIQ